MCHVSCACFGIGTLQVNGLICDYLTASQYPCQCTLLLLLLLCCNYALTAANITCAVCEHRHIMSHVPHRHALCLPPRKWHQACDGQPTHFFHVCVCCCVVLRFVSHVFVTCCSDVLLMFVVSSDGQFGGISRSDILHYLKSGSTHASHMDVCITRLVCRVACHNGAHAHTCVCDAIQSRAQSATKHTHLSSHQAA